MSEMAFDDHSNETSSLEKAAILLLSLGEQDASKILKKLAKREVQRVGAAMASLTNIEVPTVVGVIDSFMDTVTGQAGLSVGTEDYIRRALVGAVGEDKAGSLLERILGGHTKGLDKLKWMEPRTVAEFIMNEHPQIQAIVLSYLEPDQAATVLSYFADNKARIDLLLRVAALDSVPPSALQELNSVLENQVSSQVSTRFASLGGAKVAAEIMNNIESRSEEEIMQGIREADEALSTEIQDLMFVFDNLSDVDDRGIQVLLREVSTDNLVVAMKGADEILKDKIFANMSKRAAELLADDLETKGPVKVSDVESAQKEILTIARRLAEAGEINLGGAGAEEMI